MRHALTLVLLLGCAPVVPLPLTAGALAQRGDGPGLVAYLGQPDATAAVCDLRGAGPHIARADGAVIDALHEALREDRVAPALWGECVALLVRSADPRVATRMLDGAGALYRELVTDTRIEQRGSFTRKLAAVHAVLIDRPAGANPSPREREALRAELQRALRRHPGQVGRRYAGELLALLDLERGVRHGRAVDLGLLDELLVAADEQELRRCADRLPDPTLRDEARRRVIRLRIQASPDPEVRAQAHAIEVKMMAAGANAVAVADHPPRRGWLDTGGLPVRTVHVRQDLWRQTAVLLGAAPDGRVSVLPAAPLRRSLRVELQGLPRPLTLCAPPRELDPAPCLAPEQVSLGGGVVALDGEGRLRFSEELSAADVVALARERRLHIPVMVAGKPVTALIWELHFERPDDLLIQPHLDGDPINLGVRLERGAEGRLIYTVAAEGGHRLAVVERGDAGSFHIISRGSRGRDGDDGSEGSDGSTGSSGSNASCPSSPAGDGGRGGDGSPGGDGGRGRDGGDGGDIVVDVVCGQACDDLLALAARTILSEGGPGGRGGRGGRGGDGGSGGSGGNGTSCTGSDGLTTFLASGSSGTSGSDGRSGSDGVSGWNGRPGGVTIRPVP